MENTAFGRGRGVAFTPMPTVGRGRANFLFAPDASTPQPNHVGLAHNVNDTFGNAQGDVHSRVFGSEGVHEKLLTDIASQIGLSIGESIASCIETKLGNVMGPSISGATANESSLINVVVKPDVKEPVSFKGDGNDTCLIQEWETMMVSYMKKRGIPVAEQADEVLCKLTGRAREVVKVGIRSKPLLTLTDGPEPIFELLKQHFSDTVTSRLPLADFYATLPHTGECPFDYWLRLNRAMEVTEDSLKRQNKTFDNLSCDLAAMFIQNCPDPELSLIFKCRPQQKWTVADIHEKLVEHSRDRKQTPQQSQRTTVPSVTPVSTVVAPPPGQSAEGSADRLDRVIALLERVLEQQPQQTRQFSKNSAPSQRDQFMCCVWGRWTHYLFPLQKQPPML